MHKRTYIHTHKPSQVYVTGKKIKLKWSESPYNANLTQRKEDEMKKQKLIKKNKKNMKTQELFKKDAMKTRII